MPDLSKEVATQPGLTIFSRSCFGTLRLRRLRGVENQSFGVHCWTTKSEPWENASRGPLETDLLRHSFQDANYHDQIVKERKRASMASADAGPYAGTDPREKWDRPQRKKKLAEPAQAVKCPAKTKCFAGSAAGVRGYKRLHDTQNFCSLSAVFPSSVRGSGGERFLRAGGGRR